MAPVVEAVGLKKHYGKVKAVDGLDLVIEEGEIYGLLGPNGAGKTTTILILLGLTEPTAGEVRVLGYNPTREPLKVKRLTGYLPENVGFYDELSARENLRYTASLNGIPDREAKRRIQEVLEMVGLSDVADRPVGAFSRGMRQRLGIADVLLKKPKFVILDEPTSGIDPEGAREILEMIVRLRDERGMTILLSSHLLHQVQRVCQRVGIIHRGKLVAQGTVDELSAVVEKGKYRFEARVEGVNDALIEGIESLEGVEKVSWSDDTIEVIASRDVRKELARTVIQGGADLLELRGHTYTLEEIYLRYFQE
ncbi:MAG TPA: ABC transporter ATP-binding protein [Candidatus Acetothermia bacterium]|nr:ABC transporter ATP-binding protein [Candidatus Acetothermia bacterium]